MYKTQENKSIEEHMNELEEMVRNPQNIKLDSFLDFERRLEELTDRFISVLEYVVEHQGFAKKRDATGQEDYRKLQNMLYRFKAQNISQLMDSVSWEGYRLRKKLREVFEKSAYRILELTRAGKRSEVFYNIIRIFMASGVNVPPSLMEVFKPYYDLQTFQALIYTFLVSILNQEESHE